MRCISRSTSCDDFSGNFRGQTALAIQPFGQRCSRARVCGPRPEEICEILDYSAIVFEVDNGFSSPSTEGFVFLGAMKNSNIAMGLCQGSAYDAPLVLKLLKKQRSIFAKYCYES
jgi:hypothetical protein